VGHQTKTGKLPLLARDNRTSIHIKQIGEQLENFTTGLFRQRDPNKKLSVPI
jgi:hypothetical protein